MSKIDDAVQEAIQKKIEKQVATLIRKRSAQTYKQIEAILSSKKVDRMITKAIIQDLKTGLSDNGVNYFISSKDDAKLNKKLTQILFRGFK